MRRDAMVGFGGSVSEFSYHCRDAGAGEKAVHIYVCVCVCVCIHTHIEDGDGASALTHTHTHTHTHTVGAGEQALARAPVRGRLCGRDVVGCGGAGMAGGES